MGFIDSSADSIALESDCQDEYGDLELYCPHMTCDGCSVRLGKGKITLVHGTFKSFESTTWVFKLTEAHVHVSLRANLFICTLK